MKHWNFFPCLFLLLAVFWWGHVELSKTRMELDQFRPKLEINSPLLDAPFNFGAPMIPPLGLPPENTPFFDPLAPNSADGSKNHQPNGILKST